MILFSSSCPNFFLLLPSFLLFFFLLPFDEYRFFVNYLVPPARVFDSFLFSLGKEGRGIVLYFCCCIRLRGGGGSMEESIRYVIRVKMVMAGDKDG